MQDIENNMDDLFRKAASDYPLKTGESRWDEIAAAMTKVSSTPGMKTMGTKKYLALILLLFFGLLLGGIIIWDNVIINEAKEINEQEVKNQAVDIPSENNTLTQHNNPISGEVQKISGSGQIKQQDIFLKNEKIDNKNILTNKADGNQKDILLVTESNGSIISPDLPEKIAKENQDDRELKTPFSENNIDLGKNLLVNPDVSLEKTGEPEKSIEEKQITDSNKKNQQPNSKGFYFGIAAGPVFSEVNGQGLRKGGYDGGLLTGYQFNNNLSVETGVLFSKRYYFSDGKYFHTNKMPPGMDVISLEGSSSVFEIPLKVRYNILTHKKAQVYTSAGISSSILVNEKNDYLLRVNGSPQKMYSNYKNNYGYIGSTIDISIGYERKISRYSAVRIEPYLKIPLRGVGIGTMQVMSTGLHFAVTRQSR